MSMIDKLKAEQGKGEFPQLGQVEQFPKVMGKLNKVIQFSS